MTITLTPEQQAWLDAGVASGQFSSAEAAVRQFVAERMVAGTYDLAWVAPYLDAARADIHAGNFLTLDEHKARTMTRLNALKD